MGELTKQVKELQFWMERLEEFSANQSGDHPGFKNRIVVTCITIPMEKDAFQGCFRESNFEEDSGKTKIKVS